MRIAVFARYSSKMQDELSLEAQVAEMEAYVARQEGWSVTQRYALPETRSSDVEKSEEFRSMMAAAKRREFDVLLVHKLDRFGRNRETSVFYKARLRRLGVKVRSVAENLGDTVMDRAMEGMLEVMAEWYSGNLGDETRKGHKQLVRRGYWTGGKVPWGLVTVPVNEGGKTHQAYAVDPENGPTLVEVFERIARGERTGQVLAWVEARTGELWSKPTLYHRLKNPIYYGRIEYGKTKMAAGYRREKLAKDEMTAGAWEGLVSKELWDTANATVKGRTKHRRAAVNHSYLLSEGVATCALCGRNLVGSTHHGEPRYVCAGRRDGRCVTQSVPAGTLEEHFQVLVTEVLREVEVPELVRSYEASLEPEREAAKKREARLRARMTEIRAAKKNLLALVEQGCGHIPDVAQRLKDLNQEESETAELVATCQLETEHALKLNTAIVAEYLGELGQRMKEAEPEDLRAIYRDLFRLELNLEKREGQLLMKLAPEAARPLAYADNPRIWDDPCTPTIRYTPVGRMALPLPARAGSKRPRPGRVPAGASVV